MNKIIVNILKKQNWKELERQKYIEKFGYNPSGLWKKGECTCVYCKDYHTCNFAFDPYNTEGDCLLIK